MTRTGKIARLPRAVAKSLNCRRSEGEARGPWRLARDPRESPDEIQGNQTKSNQIKPSGGGVAWCGRVGAGGEFFEIEMGPLTTGIMRINADKCG